MKLNRYFVVLSTVFVLVIVMLFSSINTVFAQSLHASPASIEIGPSNYIEVSFSGASGAADDSIGLYNTATQKRITYQWLQGQKSGTLEFAAPQEPGTYEFQLWIQNWKSKVATSNKVVIDWGEVSLSQPLTIHTIAPGKKVQVTFDNAPGYRDDAIGLYDVQSGKKITYQYLQGKKSGTLEFDIPETPGTFEFQLWGNNWRKHLSTTTSFQVKWGSVGLKIGVGDPDAQGKRKIRIEFTGAPGYRDDAIGLFKAGTTTKLKYQYLHGLQDGSIEIGGIDENEALEVQLWGNNWKIMLAKTQPFVPKNGPPPPVDKEPSKHVEGQIVIVLTIGSKNAYVNNALVVLDVPPFIDSGRTFVPFRFTGESLGAEVGFTKDASGRVDTVTYKLDTTFITLYIGKREATVNGKTVYLDVAPKIVQGRTVIPLRFVTEALGCKVGWDGVKMQVTIEYPA
jgi:hypothetical protein